MYLSKKENGYSVSARKLTTYCTKTFVKRTGRSKKRQA